MRLARCLRSLHRQPQPPGYRARPPRGAPAAVAAQSRLLPQKAAQFVGARPPPSDPGGNGFLPCGDDPAVAALWRARDHPLWRSRLLSRCTRSRAAAAAGNLYLHIYGGGAVYGLGGTPRAREMDKVLARADGLVASGVRRFEPVGRKALADALSGARVMLYRGDPGETFCLALAEAQAMGIPAVVEPLGSTSERVIDGVTGCVAQADDGFVAAAVAVLRDDELWRRWHLAALERQRGFSWDTVGARFEALMNSRSDDPALSRFYREIPGKKMSSISRDRQ